MPERHDEDLTQDPGFCLDSNRNHTQQSGTTTTTTTRKPQPQEPRQYDRQKSNQTKRQPDQGPAAHTTQPPQFQRPQYSLAGSFAPQSYIDPKYYALNPSYQIESQRPLWGLARPLPRVVRHGMRDGPMRVQRNKGAEREEPGSSEIIPQVGMINEQREEQGKPTMGRAERNGYGDQRGDKRDGTRRLPSENSDVERFGTPGSERGDPMNEWLSHTHSSRSQAPDTLNDSTAGDPETGGLDRLSSIQEVPSSDGEKTRRQDSNDVDLEAHEIDDEERLKDHYTEEHERGRDQGHNSWSSIRAKFREPLAECLATMIAVLVGLATNLAVQTSNGSSGDYQSANWAWGLGITIGIYIAGGISGGHLNPAISIVLCVYRGFPLRKTCIYITAQLLGGFFAGLIAYGIYQDAIAAFDAVGGVTGSLQEVGLAAGGSGKSFFTGPESFAGASTAFFNEFVATAILACAVLALGDDSNAPPGAGMHALIVGLIVTVLTMAFGYNTGACLNPARDFGPRAATATVGYGREVFTMHNAWWLYGAWGATISGALVGGLLYDIAVFVGGESPVNYPRGRRRSAKIKAKNILKRKCNLVAKKGSRNRPRNHPQKDERPS